MNIKDRLSAQGGMFSSILGTTAAAVTNPNPAVDRYVGTRKLDGACMMRLDRLVVDPNQPRENSDQAILDKMAESIKTYGVLQPIQARWVEDLSRWMIISGEQRYHAAMQAGLTEIPCILREQPLSDADILLMQLIENHLRNSLTPKEVAVSYKIIMESQNLSARKLAQLLGLDVSTVTRRLQVAEHPAIQEAVDSGDLSLRDGADLAGVKDPGKQAKALKITKGGKLNAQQTKKLIKDLKAGKKTKIKRAKRVLRVNKNHKITIEGPTALADDLAVAELLETAAAQLRAAADLDEDANAA